jgi:hypothetical protein
MSFKDKCTKWTNLMTNSNWLKIKRIKSLKSKREFSKRLKITASGHKSKLIEKESSKKQKGERSEEVLNLIRLIKLICLKIMDLHRISSWVMLGIKSQQHSILQVCKILHMVIKFCLVLEADLIQQFKPMQGQKVFSDMLL